MNIFYDENIPYAKEFFGDFGNLTAFSGRDLTPEQVKDADVLLVRSITKVNEQLLSQNTRIKFVGTATIGFDHIDKDYLASRNIEFTNAPGCNAVSVGEYVLSAIMVMSERLSFNYFDKTVGIVGGGNTGTRLAEKLDALNISYLMHDPFLESAGDSRKFSSLEQVLACDIVSLHVPLTKTGEYPTFHLLNEERLQALATEQILINACRGEVVDNQALLSLKQAKQGPHLVLDVWENEPNVLLELIPYCQITSAHIAGYSLEGKARGTEMLYLALSKLVKTPAKHQLAQFLPQADFSEITEQSNQRVEHIRARVFQVYDVRRDDKIFREQLSKHGFDYLRKNYPVRREFSALVLGSEQKNCLAIIKNLGFNLTK
ncbi:4-phosphoerythronate dehydrogenase [Thalassomonas sp. M1454]|uniref:4-phosphoerythronate dehydrogenase n=1 Tax=Thalassomonas sp. M1454 TaxID=2594477 RepID=UPI00117DFCA5|nr:4-phosphoerythronate dehydrogenase [Thalassomonas sp. M1454]TRX57279.1 4-phosphoerythronate dehydrogenase [Thalassomonas sp. M1454]